MKTNYFINIDFHNDKINKFTNAIVSEDLSKKSLHEIAKETVKTALEAMNSNEDINSLIINVKAFNKV